MDSDDKTDDSVQNFMHQTNEKIRIGKNSKFTQHEPEFENANDEEQLEAPHRSILATNTVKNDCIRQSKNLLGGHTRSRPHSSFSPLDSNCTKQRFFAFVGIK